MNIVKMEEVCQFINGGSWSEKEYVNYGIPVLKVSNCKNNKFQIEDINYLPFTLRQKYAKNKLSTGDVIIATVGSHPNLIESSAGRSVVVNSLVDGFYLNQNAVCLRTKNSDILDQVYLGYLCRERNFVHYIQNKGRGAANQMRIAISSIKEYEFNLPSIYEQRQLANILSAYDDLIENNQKQIKLLEEVAQRLYKEWFIDLRFPGHENIEIVDGIPEGWNIRTLGDFKHRLESGSRPKGGIDSNLKDGIPSIGAENVIGLGKYNFSSEKLISKEFYENMNKGKLKDRDILIYKDGAYIGRTSLFQDDFPHREASVNEHVFLLHMDDEVLQYYVFLTLYRPEYYLKMQNLNKNAAQPGINMKALKTLDILVPDEDIVAEFNDLVSPIIKSIFSKSKQIKMLTESRDRLLPKLMSGEIEV